MTEQEKQLEQKQATLKKMQKFAVRTTAKKVRTTNALVRLLSIVLSASTLLMVASWGVAKFMNSTGFTVSLDQKQEGLSLFDNAEATNPTSKLSANPVENMWNISVDWISKNVANESFGTHNGDADKDGKTDYIAYTFLLGNDTDEDIKYDSQVYVTSVEKNADEAVRVKVIRNDVEKNYAKPAKTGGVETVAADASWIDPVTVIKEESEIIKSGERIKYTVCVWLEGDDPECVNDILGGEVELSMAFSVVDDKTGNGELV